MVVGMSRRAIAEKLGHPDTSAGIPEARWIRAMTFEGLVHHERFVSQLLTTAVGALGLDRPVAVRRADCGVSVAKTLAALEAAHANAVTDQEATMITSLAVPFVGMEHEPDATQVKPDFAIVAPRTISDHAVGSWLIMGDAKDYERVRSRIDDQRMLKGFLQVALGAESAADWSALPEGMEVHTWGALAVPRNAFLQPEAIVERLDDHRREVRVRVDERTELLRDLGRTPLDEDAVDDFVSHLEAEFDPSSCSTCAMFNYCRSELRAKDDTTSLLVELGVRPEMRPAMTRLIDDGEAMGLPESAVAAVKATRSGLAESTGQLRVDPASMPGSVNVVLAKADSAALGVHGIGLQRVLSDGSVTPWAFHVIDVPQSSETRSGVMELLGEQLEAALATQSEANADSPGPVCVVTPDNVTADVLVSIADSLAGVETSRLRWQRDLDQGREALTFDGEPATVPEPLSENQRLAVSFLLEEDRARAMTLRWPLIDLRSVLANHVVPGGPQVDRGRLDYLVTWAEAAEPLDHRAVSDAIASSENTPGARLANRRSDAMHRTVRSDKAVYNDLVIDELGYKADIVDRALAILDKVDDSKLRQVNCALEADAQGVWRLRLALHASDLVRFGRTGWVWRNSHVELLDADGGCATQLAVVGNPHVARDAALEAGQRYVALATVVSVSPLKLAVQSRRIGDGASVVALQVNGEPCVEDDATTLKIQKGSFKFSNLSVGPLSADDSQDDDAGLIWAPKIEPELHVGDELVVADLEWFGNPLKSGHEIGIKRPSLDRKSAPKDDCHAHSYDINPEDHQWCCRSHEDAEAEWSDELADRRRRGELNPQVWPPVIDADEFDTPAVGSPTAESDEAPAQTRPAEHLTIDDLD